MAQMEESTEGVGRSAWLGFGALAAVVGSVVFGVAGTLRYVEAWVLLAAFFGASLTITLFLMKRDPLLLRVG
jgi:hypothetical protein